MLLQLLVFAGLSALMLRAEKEADAASFSNEVMTRTTMIAQGLQDYGSSMLLYLATKNLYWKERFERLSDKLPKEVANLEQDLPHNSEDYTDLKAARESFEYILTSYQERMTRLKSDYSYLELMELRQMLKLGLQPRFAELYQSLEKIIDRHNRQAMQFPRLQQGMKNHLKLLLFAGFLLNLTATFIMVLGFNKGITKRISIIADNFLRFREQNTLNPPQSGLDEISFLDKSFHQLASELSDASAKDKAIFANMPVGLVACDRLGSVESVNPFAEDLLEIPAVNMVGRNFSDFVIGRDEPISKDAEATIPPPIKPDRYYLRKQNEKGFPAHISFSRYQHSGQEKLLYSFVDMSAIEEIENLKQEFISIISHDLRAPLSSIKGCLLLLSQGALGDISPDAAKYVETAGQESDRLIRLTTDLLDIARMESGNIVLEKRPVVCDELIKQAVAVVKPLAEVKGISLSAAPSSLKMIADPDRVCQILVNFLSNAIKYSAANTQVNIQVQTVDSSIRFSVIDEGRGIPTDFVATVFDRFKQVKSEDSKDGSGLGLAICKLLAEAHKGTVGVDSTVGKGSTFWLQLPAS
jgi:signal transduction histidine kinase